MKLQQKQVIFAQNVALLIQHIASLGYQCTLGEVERSAQQAALYAQEGKGIINSLHCKRLAIDINLFDKQGTYLSDSKYYKQIADYWEKLDPLNRAGINFKRVDGNHFEMQDL